MGEVEEVSVLIVGAGPSGLAVAACLSGEGIEQDRVIILEREDCIAPLWHKRCYDRVRLHLAKQFCSLPFAPHGDTLPKYIPAKAFADYVDAYAARFRLRPRLRRHVVSAVFDEADKLWCVVAEHYGECDRDQKMKIVRECYKARFLVVASGENDEIVVPEVDGMESFPGEVLHSCEYRNGEKFAGKRVLVVGAGNSGWEIAYDLWEAGASPCMVIRSPVHMVCREIWHWAHFLFKFLPVAWVDSIVLFLCYLKYGDTSKYGIRRPSEGPLCLKLKTAFYPVVDVGTYHKIKSGEIKVLPSMKKIERNNVEFVGGMSYHFDAIIFATGFRSTVRKWLKGDDDLIDDNGMAKQRYPNHWKGRNGLYCAGLIGRGFQGCSEDALRIANDIKTRMESDKMKL